MAEKIRIFDTTLRDGEQTPGVNLNMDEKLEIARHLETLGVDVIEAGFPASSPGDFEAVRRIAQQIRQSEMCIRDRLREVGRMAAYIYASMSGEDSIWVVDADRFVPLRVIPLPRGSRPGSLACNPREGALYCACRESVEVFDLLQGGRLRSLPLPGPDVVGMALSGANEIQLLSNESSCIATLDAQDGALYQVVPTALAPTRLETGHNGLVSVSGSVENEVRVYKPVSYTHLGHEGIHPAGQQLADHHREGHHRHHRRNRAGQHRHHRRGHRRGEHHGR